LVACAVAVAGRVWATLIGLVYDVAVIILELAPALVVLLPGKNLCVRESLVVFALAFPRRTHLCNVCSVRISRRRWRRGRCASRGRWITRGLRRVVGVLVRRVVGVLVCH
jgi:hypothetical protein